MGRTRTFLAIDINKPVRASVTKVQEDLAELGADVKWVEPANLHLTMLFLGEVDDRDLVAICRAATKVAADIKQFSMVLEGVGAFPNTRRPRTLWVGVNEGKDSVIALHKALENALFDLGCYRREARAFAPHLTLGRVNSARNEESLVTAISENADRICGETNVSEVLVMGSELKSSGPEYTVIGRAKLTGKAK
ncbi:RNA 2',3'-cyclic phosphodiesterase [soil metagenome]